MSVRCTRPAVRFQSSQLSTVPAQSWPAAARADPSGMSSSSQRSFPAVNPGVEWQARPRLDERRQAVLAQAGRRGRPSGGTARSRAGPRVVRCRAPRAGRTRADSRCRWRPGEGSRPQPRLSSMQSRTAVQTAMASCCTQPGRGYSMAIGREAWATMRPRGSTRMAFVFVVPWSMARISASLATSPPARQRQVVGYATTQATTRRRIIDPGSDQARAMTARVATQYVALFGDPVDGNPTSRMQNAAFEAAGLDWRYLDIRVAADGLAAAISAARALGFGGLNLTIPHKVAVLPLLDELAPSAEISAACNTVVREADGRLVGSNTDGQGFLWSLRDEGIDPEGRCGRAPRRGRCRAGRRRRAGARRCRADRHRGAGRGSPRRARRAPALAHERVSHGARLGRPA